MNRAEQIKAQVLKDHGNIWDAFDQGRWAHASSIPRENNPHLPGHSNSFDWYRGWDEEEERKAKLGSVALRRIIEEVRDGGKPEGGGYNRTYHRHNR